MSRKALKLLINLVDTAENLKTQHYFSDSRQVAATKIRLLKNDSIAYHTSKMILQMHQSKLTS